MKIVSLVRLRPLGPDSYREGCEKAINAHAHPNPEGHSRTKHP
jgi:hypothetical protein